MSSPHYVLLVAGRLHDVDEIVSPSINEVLLLLQLANLQNQVAHDGNEAAKDSIVVIVGFRHVEDNVLNQARLVVDDLQNRLDGFVGSLLALVLRPILTLVTSAS